jgi:hypothetical protein
MIRSAYSLIPGDSVYIKQVEGEVISLKTPAEITHTWQNGPCITILTSRGYVELDELETVEVA